MHYFHFVIKVKKYNLQYLECSNKMNEEIKLAIVGGRDYTDYQTFTKIVDEYIREFGTPSLIISGGAKGVDTMAYNYAKTLNIPVEVLAPEWNKYGKQAGLLRNTDIIEASTHVLALPTDKSRGTYDSIRKAQNAKKHLKVVKV